MLQSGSGFFIDKNGTALADYQLFKQASKAKVVSGEGKEYEVGSHRGSQFIIRFGKVPGKNRQRIPPALTISDRMGVKHEHVYVLPTRQKKTKCVNDTLHDIQKFNEKYGLLHLRSAIGRKVLEQSGHG